MASFPCLKRAPLWRQRAAPWGLEFPGDGASSQSVCLGRTLSYLTNKVWQLLVHGSDLNGTPLASGVRPRPAIVSISSPIARHWEQRHIFFIDIAPFGYWFLVRSLPSGSHVYLAILSHRIFGIVSFKSVFVAIPSTWFKSQNLRAGYKYFFQASGVFSPHCLLLISICHWYQSRKMPFLESE